MIVIRSDLTGQERRRDKIRKLTEAVERRGDEARHNGNHLDAASNYRKASELWRKLGMLNGTPPTARAQCFDNWIEYNRLYTREKALANSIRH